MTGGKRVEVRRSISFSELRSPWTAVGKREFCEQPFWNDKGNNRILVIRFTAQSQSTSLACYGACLKWLLLELSFSDRWSTGRKVSERCCSAFGPDVNWAHFALSENVVSISFTLISRNFKGELKPKFNTFLYRSFTKSKTCKIKFRWLFVSVAFLFFETLV